MKSEKIMANAVEEIYNYLANATLNTTYEEEFRTIEDIMNKARTAMREAYDSNSVGS